MASAPIRRWPTPKGLAGAVKDESKLLANNWRHPQALYLGGGRRIATSSFRIFRHSETVQRVEQNNLLIRFPKETLNIRAPVADLR